MGAAGLSLTKTSEGKVNRVYRDPVGILTACYGHTGPELRMGQTFSDAQCEAMLVDDLKKHRVALIGPRNCIGSAPLTQNQHDALLDFTFNVGTGAFCSSTMAKHVKARYYVKAAQEFPKWVYARKNGVPVKLPGLIKRRTAEKALFETPDTRPPSSVPSGALRALTHE